MAASRQLPLFELPGPSLPDGMAYDEEWLSENDERALVALVATLPLEHARYHGYPARRRVVGYGGSDGGSDRGGDGGGDGSDTKRLLDTAPLIDALQPLRRRAARWAGLAPSALVHTLVAEYPPGAPLGWHRDVPDFEDVVGVSLGHAAVMRFRPYPPRAKPRGDVLRLTVAPRSIYLLRGPARWAWQHSVAPVAALRWSITFRTAAATLRPSDGGPQPRAAAIT